MTLQVWSRYPHLYYSIPGRRDEKPKGMCLCCLKEQKCEYYKNGTDINYKNLFYHIAKQHPSMLLPGDVNKMTKEDDVENQMPSKRKDPFTITATAVNKRTAKEEINEISKLLRDETAVLCADAFLPFSLIENEAFQFAVGRIIDKVTGKRNRIRWLKRRALTSRVKKYVSESVGSVIETFRKDVKATSQGTEVVKACFATDGTSCRRNHYIAINSSRVVPRSLPDEGKTTFKLEEHYLMCSVDNERQNQMQAFFHFAKSVEKILDVKIIEYDVNESGIEVYPTLYENGVKVVNLNRVRKLKDHVTAVVLDDGSGTCGEVCRALGITVLLCVAHKLNNFMKAIFKDKKIPGDPPVYESSLAKKVTTPVYEVLAYIRSSDVAVRELWRVQKSLNHVQKGPVQVPTTRWCYSATSIGRYIEISDDIQGMDADNRERMYFRSNIARQEFKDRRVQANSSLLELGYLEPFYDRVFYWIRQTEYGKQVTISCLLYMRDDLLMFLDRTREDVGAKAMDPRRKIALVVELTKYTESLKEYLVDDHTHQSFEDILVYKIAELLDPRFAVSSRSTGVRNRDYFNDTFIAFYENNLRKMIVPDLVDRDENDADDEVDTNIFHVQDFQVETTAAGLQKACFVKEVKDYSKVVSTYYINKTTEEVDTWRNSFSVLDFWFEKREEFPVLSALATRVLEIPAQESCAERSFSGLARLLTNARASVTAQLAGDMVINYMKKHRSRQGKLMPYPSLGKDWPAGLKGFVRLPPRDDDQENELIDDEMIENVDGQVAAAEDDGQVTAAEDEGAEGAEEQTEDLIEDGIYPDDEPQRPQRAARQDYAAMVRGYGR